MANLEKYIETATPTQAKALSVSQLQTAAQLAKTDAQATIVYEALLDKVDRGQISINAINDTYISITSATQSKTAVTVKYKIKSKVPSGAHVVLGVRYPGATRIPAKTKNISGMSAGTYTEVFSASGIIAKQVFTEFTARDYTSTSVYKTLYMSTSSSYDYHTITAAEVIGHYAVTQVAPFVSVFIFPQSKIVKYVATAAEAAGIAYTFTGALSIRKGLPSPVVGQYYQTRTWYSENKLYTQIKVWANKTLYTRGEPPMYDSGAFVAVYLPGF